MLFRHIFTLTIMNFCDHVSWLHICDRNDVIVHHDDRVIKVFQDLINVRAQYFFVICFLKRKQKLTVMREIFLHNNFRRSHRTDFVNLRLNFVILKFDFFLFLLNNDSLLSMFQFISPSVCHDKKILLITWSIGWDHHAKITFYDRFIFLFCDVICIFVENFEKLTKMTKFLKFYF